MALSFFEYLLSFQRYSSFCSKIDDVTNHFNTQMNHKIKNISGNIGVMLLGPVFFNFTHQLFTVLHSVFPHDDVRR